MQKSYDVEDVAGFLRDNKEFFKTYPDLLMELTIPHQVGGAVSLIERQVDLLRQENRQLRNKIKELVNIARENDALMAKLHRTSVELVAAESVEAFITLLYDRLPAEFGADALSIRLFDDLPGITPGSRKEYIARSSEGLQYFDAILVRGKPVCGKFNGPQMQFLFPEQQDTVQSVAVVPLTYIRSMGMFAIGSRDGERFRAGMSTVFLNYLGEIASVALKRFVA
jgi:uncharacterized protein YigA (DUF484 family)